jgi:hypothetical protein
VLAQGTGVVTGGGVGDMVGRRGVARLRSGWSVVVVDKAPRVLAAVRARRWRWQQAKPRGYEA